MAFDQTTRNRLQRFVNDARRVLEEEFTRQLQNDYGMDPNAGTIAELASLRHINDAQRETARILRDTLAHYTASGDINASQGLDRIVREQAFTVLNRLAALRMAEARGLLVESVGNGFQAKGFQLYARLAGTGLGETGDAYRVYLFSVFDELAQDLPGLFDRYSPQGRLFPREAALLQVLNLINDADIARLWAEDETIGWIYQYFNSQEERKAMRDASQAPRNSRELAVRNQFFTPRYVVEFLVDNTLGRLWVNATGGKTHLRERCRYLLEKPDETPPPATKLRDPRTLKLLDPACGSMHFGLYAFDLFVEMYREAWGWEQQHGPGSLDVSIQPQAALRPLSQTYKDETAFFRDVPRLIIEYNIYGVDIDPRAAQIASLALWLRAQRAWHDDGVKAKDRPLIGTGHVLAAVASPSERELRRAFAGELEKHDAELFEKTLLLLKGLPELGVLLLIEQDLPALVRKVYPRSGVGLFAQEEQDDWRKAESRLRDALYNFTQKSKASYQGRLFAQDYLQGLKVIDLLENSFDVVVMNPPFGKVPKEAENYCRDRYASTWTDVYGCFLWRFLVLAKNQPLIGSITSSQFLYTKQMRELRKRWVETQTLSVLIELGQGVLDDATVETALTISAPSATERAAFIDLTESASKAEDLVSACAESRAAHGSSKGLKLIQLQDFKNLYLSPFCYHLDPRKLNLWAGKDTVDPSVATVAVGNNTFDDFRFQRLRWEVPSDTINLKWFGYEEGGEFQPFFSPTPSLYNWKNDGSESRAFQIHKFGTDAQVKQSISLWWREGITYPRVSSIGFGPRYMPRGHVFSGDSISIFPTEADFVKPLLAYLCSTWAEDLSYAFGRYRKIEARAIANLPIPPLSQNQRSSLTSAAKLGISIFVEHELHNEVSPIFWAPQLPKFVEHLLGQKSRSLNSQIESLYSELDSTVAKILFGETPPPATVAKPRSTLVRRVISDDWPDQASSRELFSWFVGVAFGRWAASSIHSPATLSPEEIFEGGLPLTPPGMHSDPANGPGILVDEEGSPLDLIGRIREALDLVFGPNSHQVETWLEEALDVSSLRHYLRPSSGFFGDHLKRYSKGARKAPIYWPISSASGSYTLWIYYPRLNGQTLYTAINDILEPKLAQIGSEVSSLRSKSTARTRQDERDFEALQAFELELLELRDSLLALAQKFLPNLDDGVLISASPLWSLFRHKPWQKVLKETWAKLEKGDYDWAHLAMNYWPDRVREKCKTDKSLAIAHGTEHLYIEPEAAPKKTRGRKKAGGDE